MTLNMEMDRMKSPAMVEAPTRRTTMKPTVLVVEDEEALSTLLRYNLEKEGYNVVTTADGEEASLLVRECNPDLVLLDWMLPSLSGIELCRRLHSHRNPKLADRHDHSARRGSGPDQGA